jgi:FAD:protein FMN transferase
MKQTALIMGMPITVELVGFNDAEAAIADTFDYFRKVDARYSTYKPSSEISQINRGLPREKWSGEMRAVLDLCEQTKRETDGYFDIRRGEKIDPSGLVKGWAIQQAAKTLRKRGVENFYIEAGGDIQTNGTNASDESWRIGIRNPFDEQEIIKVLTASGQGVATSGTYIRGQHIYDPHTPDAPIETVKSLTVIGPNIYDADRFATAAFAMEANGIRFIDSLESFEGYMIDANKSATFTRGFERYVA